LYVPKVGWRELNGELDLDLTYELVPREKNLLHGTLALREVSVNVLRLQDAAVGWKSLFVSLDGIDLLAQHAAVHEVTLDGARIRCAPAAAICCRCWRTRAPRRRTTPRPPPTRPR
jgi:hypothetical protein